MCGLRTVRGTSDGESAAVRCTVVGSMSAEGMERRSRKRKRRNAQQAAGVAEWQSAASVVTPPARDPKTLAALKIRTPL